MPRAHRAPIALSSLLPVSGAALVIAALAACAESAPQPSTPTTPSTAEAPSGAAQAPSAAAQDTPAPTAAPTAPTATPSAAPAPTAGAAADPDSEVELTVQLDRMEKQGKKLVYDADSNRMTATHRVYELDAAELSAALGGKSSAKEAKMRLSCGPAATKNVPGDPNGARPMGGFLHETRTCKIVKLLSAE
jgi:hypothetical protein